MYIDDTISVNILRKEFAYVSSIVDLKFTLAAGHPVLDIRYNNTPSKFNWDGMTTFIDDNRTEITILPKFKSQSYLFLHELGHVLGLDHHGTSVEDTLMVPSYTINSKYTSSELSRIATYTTSDIIDLWGRYGISREYVGEIKGDLRNNILFGGTHATDYLDGDDTIFGMHGNDTIYGNGGNDIIYGGTSVADPTDSADTVYGGVGDDLIYGNGGNDVLYGNQGADTLYGGLGADTFYVDNYDQVIDYQSTADTLIYVG